MNIVDEVFKKQCLSKLSDKQILLLCCDCSRKVLPIYEKYYSHEEPRLALNTSIAYLLGRDFSKEISSLSQTVYDIQQYVRNNNDGVPWSEYESVNNSIDTLGYMLFCFDRVIKKDTDVHISQPASNCLISAYYAFHRCTLPFEWFYYEAYNNGKVFSPNYKTPDTMGLAQEIVQGDNFSLMPILSDAIMDLGCPEEDANVVRYGKGLSNWALYNLVK